MEEWQDEHLLQLPAPRLFVWGSGSQSSHPSPLEFFDHAVATSCACGSDTTVVVTDDGAVYQLDSSGDWQAGLIDTAGAHIRKVFIGEPCTVAISETGELVAWGSNKFASVRVGGRNLRMLSPVDSAGSTKPPLASASRLKQLSGRRVQEVAMGRAHMVVLLESGHVYSWGANEHQQLGHSGTTPQGFPTQIKGLGRSSVASLHCGGDFSLAVTDTGALLSWGCNSHGQLGHSEGQQSADVKRVGLLRGHWVMSASCGCAHSAVVTSIGEVFTWGSSEYGQCGTGHPVTQIPPTRIPDLQSVRVAVCGSHHTHVLTDRGDLYSFGRTSKGVLGHHTTDSVALTTPPTEERCCATPVVVPFSEYPGALVLTAYAGATHMAALVVCPSQQPTLLNETAALDAQQTQQLEAPSPNAALTFANLPEPTTVQDPEMSVTIPQLCIPKEESKELQTQYTVPATVPAPCPVVPGPASTEEMLEVQSAMLLELRGKLKAEQQARVAEQQCAELVRAECEQCRQDLRKTHTHFVKHQDEVRQLTHRLVTALEGEQESKQQLLAALEGEQDFKQQFAASQERVRMLEEQLIAKEQQSDHRLVSKPIHRNVVAEVPWKAPAGCMESEIAYTQRAIMELQLQARPSHTVGMFSPPRGLQAPRLRPLSPFSPGPAVAVVRPDRVNRSTVA